MCKILLTLDIFPKRKNVYLMWTTQRLNNESSEISRGWEISREINLHIHRD